MKKAEIPIRNLTVEGEMEVRDKQKMQSKSEDLLNRESVNDELFDTSRLLEDVLERDNMLKAMYRVIRNKGSHGIDGMKTDELREHVKRTWTTVKSKLLEGKYNPSPVRRVEIPKPDGGIRLLGIPTVQDRMIQQAIAQVLSEIYEPVFSNYSFGFRPNRSAHDAIYHALDLINYGYEWIVDLDIEKYFDTVNHDKLISILRENVNDRRTLHLIRSFMRAGVMDNGFVSSNTRGVPQGGPLSPVISNVYLDKFDKELEARNLNFVRYADYTEVETMPKLSLKHRRYQGFS